MTSKKGADASSTKWSKRSAIIATLGFLLAAYTGYVLYLNNLPDIGVFHQTSMSETGRIYSTITVENTGGRVKDIDCEARAGLLMRCTTPSGDAFRIPVFLKDHFYPHLPTGLSKGIISRIDAKESHIKRIFETSYEVYTTQSLFRIENSAVPHVRIRYRDILGFSHTQYYFGKNEQLKTLRSLGDRWGLWDAPSLTSFSPYVVISIEDFTLDNLQAIYRQIYLKTTKDHN